VKRLRRLLVIVALVVVGIWMLMPRMGPSIAPDSILVLELSGGYAETAEPALLPRLVGQPQRPFASLLSEIAKAERDDRLGVVIFRIRDLRVGWAKSQEIRDAIRSLSRAGRRTVAYLELASFAANLQYYVASAADEVYAAPATRAPVVGLAAEYLFLGGFWDLLGVEIEVERIGRYKTAADSFAARSMSDAHREMADALLDSVDEQFVSGIATTRGLSQEAVRAAVDAAPIDPDEMLDHGLIDGMLFEDELIEKLGAGPVVRGADYARVDPARVGFDPVARFALVYGSGNVVTGRGRMSPSGNPVLASDTVSKALEDAAEDPDIDAIIFRIDSPGGSPLASDIVWRAAQKARDSGKPLIASFSDVAASGGYYVATGADAIVASPASITGSIGVFVLRPVLGGLFEKLEIGVESLTRGDHADLQLASHPLSPGTRERLRSEVASIYELFLERVADGRSLDRDRVDAVGRGRVWTGAQAAEVGLVDELGGLRTAVLRGKREIGLDPDADVALVGYPPPKSLLEQFDDVLRGAAVRLAPATPAADLLRRLEPWLHAAASRAPAALLPFALEIH
jgi:protease-4